MLNTSPGVCGCKLPPESFIALLMLYEENTLGLDAYEALSSALLYQHLCCMPCALFFM